MVNGIKQTAKKVLELSKRLFEKRYIEVQTNGKVKNVWFSRYSGIAI